MRKAEKRDGKGGGNGRVVGLSGANQTSDSPPTGRLPGRFLRLFRLSFPPFSPFRLPRFLRISHLSASPAFRASALASGTSIRRPIR